jgi:hypothetical protein
VTPGPSLPLGRALPSEPSWDPPTITRSDTIHVIVRAAHADDGQPEGEVLQEFDSREPVAIGETLILPDGRAGTITGVSDRFDDNLGWLRTVRFGIA